MSENILTQERLKKLLTYDPETGVFVWAKQTSRIKIGDVAGCNHSSGYRNINIDYKQYSAHRLVWLYMVGAFPPDQIDHINRNKSDNRFANLRAVTGSENQHNANLKITNTSGYKGVYYHKTNKKWAAEICLNNVKNRLGNFSTPEEASAAYLAAQKIYHPTYPI